MFCNDTNTSKMQWLQFESCHDVFNRCWIGAIVYNLNGDTIMFAVFSFFFFLFNFLDFAEAIIMYKGGTNLGLFTQRFA